MKKVILAGSFDCLKQKQIHLIREALKLAIGGELFVLLYGDYQHFKDYGFFPVQPYLLRENNLKYFVKPSNIILREGWLKDIDKAFFLSTDDKAIFMHYGDEKDFPCRDDLAKAKIPIKFIKPYGQS